MEADPVTTLQNQINVLSQQLNQANVTIQQLSAALQNLVGESRLNTAKPEKFSGTNNRARIKFLENMFSSQTNVPNEDQNLKFAITVMSGDGLQWWELACLDMQNSIMSLHILRRKSFFALKQQTVNQMLGKCYVI